MTLWCETHIFREHSSRFAPPWR